MVPFTDNHYTHLKQVDVLPSKNKWSIGSHACYESENK